MNRLAVALIGLCFAAGGYEARVGGKVAPDGKTEVQIDLPFNMQKENISSRGLGCCVFRSIDHAAHWASEPALYGMPEWMVAKGIAGGGYPQKVADLVPKIAKDRGLPAPPILQVQGPDTEIIKKASRSGIMPCVTYGVSPTGRYGGQTIAHMVNTANADDKYFSVLDNNYIRSFEWMNPQEFQRSYTTNGGGWSVFLLRWGPPPMPKN